MGYQSFRPDPWGKPVSPSNPEPIGPSHLVLVPRQRRHLEKREKRGLSVGQRHKTLSAPKECVRVCRFRAMITANEKWDGYNTAGAVSQFSFRKVMRICYNPFMLVITGMLSFILGYGWHMITTNGSKILMPWGCENVR